MCCLGSEGALLSDWFTFGARWSLQMSPFILLSPIVSLSVKRRQEAFDHPDVQSASRLQSPGANVTAGAVLKRCDDVWLWWDVACCCCCCDCFPAKLTCPFPINTGNPSNFQLRSLPLLRQVNVEKYIIWRMEVRGQRQCKSYRHGGASSARARRGTNVRKTELQHGMWCVRGRNSSFDRGFGN